MTSKICTNCQKQSFSSMPWCPVCGGKMVIQKLQDSNENSKPDGTNLSLKQRPATKPVSNKTFKQKALTPAPGYTLVFSSKQAIGTTVTSLLDSHDIVYYTEADSNLKAAGKKLFPRVFVKNSDVKKCLELFEKHGLG